MSRRCDFNIATESLLAQVISKTYLLLLLTCTQDPTDHHVVFFRGDRCSTRSYIHLSSDFMRHEKGSSSTQIFFQTVVLKRFFRYVRFLSSTLTIYRTTGERSGPSLFCFTISIQLPTSGYLFAVMHLRCIPRFLSRALLLNT